MFGAGEANQATTRPARVGGPVEKAAQRGSDGSGSSSENFLALQPNSPVRSLVRDRRFDRRSLPTLGQYGGQCS